VYENLYEGTFDSWKIALIRTSELYNRLHSNNFLIVYENLYEGTFDSWKIALIRTSELYNRLHSNN
jgi:subtilisin-like proprotein convertase family protein